MELDAGALLSYAEQARRAAGVHVTMTHLVGRAVAHGLTVVPGLRVWLTRGREHPRESVDVFFIVTAAGGRELSPRSQRRFAVPARTRWSAAESV